MTDPPKRSRTISSTLALCLAAIGAVSMLYYHQGIFTPQAAALRAAQGLDKGYSFGNDFFQVWYTSRSVLQKRRNVYSPAMTSELQTGVFGRSLDPNRRGEPIDQRRFPYPAFTILLFWPAAAFPFESVRVVVVCVLVVLTSASIVLWFWAMDWHPSWSWITFAALLTLSSYQGLEGLYAGQLGLLVAFLLAASIFALGRGRFLFSGFLMGLTMIKPQVCVLAILYLLPWSLSHWRHRGRFCVGFILTTTLLVAASLVAMPQWIGQWLHTIIAYHKYTRAPVIGEVITDPLGPPLAGPLMFVLTVTSIIVAMVLAWRNRTAAFGSLRFWLTLTVLFSITTITILPGPAVYDHVILVPAILLLGRYRENLWQSGRVVRILMRLGFLILFWPYMSALVLIALRPWLAPTTFHGIAILSPPLRAAAPVLFVTLALLGWMWHLRRLNPSEFA